MSIHRILHFASSCGDRILCEDPTFRLLKDQPGGVTLQFLGHIPAEYCLLDVIAE